MSNPYLGKIFADVPETTSNTMSVAGAITKSLGLAILLLGSIALSWHQLGTTGLFFGIVPAAAMTGAAVGGLLCILGAIFIRGLIIPLAILYALLEGVFLGIFTVIVNGLYPGLPFIAAGATATTVCGVLILYQLKILRATPAFIKIVLGATVGLILFLGVTWLLSLFGVTTLRDTITGSGSLGIGFSIFCVVLAALNLVIDFHVIEQGAARKAPKRMEWHAALGLMVTLIWLYVSLLQLLMKLQNRN